MDLTHIQINQADNVAVALQDLAKHAKIRVNDQHIILQNHIPFGHKVAVQDMAQGDQIMKYGFPIGHASNAIRAGEHVHTHNVKTNLDENLTYTYKPALQEVNIAKEDRTFMGYLRKNGDVGIRNEFWIVPTVGCVNGQAKQIIKHLQAETDTSYIDSLEVLSHQYGCSQLGDDHDNTKKALAAAITHPNAGAVLVLGLGCENNQVGALKELLGDYDESRIRFLVSQEVDDEVQSGLTLARELVQLMKQDVRSPQSLTKLKIGLKCGGSDAFSGITANPLLGAFSDWFIAQGGSTVLTEVPEMFGAETTLMNRAKDEATFNKTVNLINGFKDYFRQNNQTIYENPSPGNKAGGITTLEEKSIGAIQKGGSAAVVDVLDYGTQIKKQGLSLLWAPGNDLVSSSALGMAGCQIVLFTTGRGTPFGSFIPTLKVATNSTLFNKKTHWMDFNAGQLLRGANLTEVRNLLVEKILNTANGEPAKHELAEFKEIAIFKSGVTL